MTSNTKAVEADSPSAPYPNAAEAVKLTKDSLIDNGFRPNFNGFNNPYSTSGVNESLQTSGITYQQRYGNGFQPHHQPPSFFNNQCTITDFANANGMLYCNSKEVVELTKDFLEKELALYEAFVNELNTKANTANYPFNAEILLANKRTMVEFFMRNYWREEFLTNEVGLTFFLRLNPNTLKKEFKEELVTSLNAFKNKGVPKMRLVIDGCLVNITKNQMVVLTFIFNNFTHLYYFSVDTQSKKEKVSDLTIKQFINTPKGKQIMARKAAKTKAAVKKEVVGAGFTPLSPNTYTNRFVSLDEKARKEQTKIDDDFKASKQEALIMARAIIVDAMGGGTNAAPEIRENAQNGFTKVLADINEAISTLR